MAASDILIEIYFILTEQKKKEGEDKIGTIAKLNLYQAVDVVTQKEKKVLSFAEDEQRMMLMGLRRFTKIYHMPNIGLRETLLQTSSRNEYCFKKIVFSLNFFESRNHLDDCGFTFISSRFT
jgi:hypothetical protein